MKILASGLLLLVLQMLRVLVALALVASAFPVLILLLNGKGEVGGAAIVGSVTVGVSVLAGAPLALWFVMRGWFKFWQCALAGSLLGTLVGIALNSFVELNDIVVFVLKFAAIGGVHTSAFWVLAFWRNQSLVGVGAYEVPKA
jgi:hypothetical protein